MTTRAARDLRPGDVVYRPQPPADPVRSEITHAAIRFGVVHVRYADGSRRKYPPDAPVEVADP